MTYKRIFVSENASASIRNCLSQICEKLVLIKNNPELPPPVAAHANMQMLLIDDTLIITKELYRSLSSDLPDNIIIAFADNNHTDKYPGDVNLNALYVSNCLFANTSSLDPAVKRICSDKGINIANVKQGYAKCSTLSLGDNGLITADKGIADAARENGLDVLLISPGGIELKGYDYGFLGGASFYDYIDRSVYFFGDVKKHSDFAEIFEFCSSKDIEVNICDSSILTDIGGAVAIK